MPFFRKREAFDRVLPINRPFLAKPHIEVVLSLDEDSELDQVLDTIGRSPEIRWRVVACHEPHEWRPPAKAINVGLRHAEGDYVLIVSPETAFVNDVPSQVLAHLAAFPDAAICGRLSYSTFAELDHCRDAYEAMVQARYGTGLTAMIDEHYYGTVAVSRETVLEVSGFDECFETWGGDDDNFRARLVLAGATILRTPDINTLHLDATPRESRWRRRSWAEERQIRRPKATRCPDCSRSWGTAFDDVVYDYRRPAARFAMATIPLGKE
jgi:glycosyl transferase family 7 (putative galactosyltransferase)